MVDNNTIVDLATSFANAGLTGIEIAAVLARMRLELAAPDTVRIIRRTVTLAPEAGTRVRVVA